MKSYLSFFKNSRFQAALVSAGATALFITAVVSASTTISTNIVTQGTLAVTGASTLTGLTSMVYASSTTQSLTGNLLINGYATTTGSNGNIATAGTLTVTGDSLFSANATTTGAHRITGLFNVNGNATTTASSGNIASQGTFTSVASTPNTFPYASTTAITATTASTTNLIVGGDSADGTFAGMIFGTCNLQQSSITASTTRGVQCTTATGISTAYKVFVQATSTLTGAVTLGNASNGFVIVSASSTAANIIGVELSNLTGVVNTPAGTLNFWAVR